MRVIANLPTYMCAKNYPNRTSFDKVIAKIKWCSFFDSHGIFVTCIFTPRDLHFHAMLLGPSFSHPAFSVKPLAIAQLGKNYAHRAFW